MGVTATDICNRALQRIGAGRIAAGALLTEDSKNASECVACYDILRRAELRRNVWRFTIRTCALRGIDVATQKITFGTYAAGTSYAINDVVVASDGQAYFSLSAANVGHDPTTSPLFWTLYFGLETASQYVIAWNSSITYGLGYAVTGSNGTRYKSLVPNNINNDPTVVPAAWNSGTTYAAGKFAKGSDGNIYQSIAGSNTNHNPTSTSGFWNLLAADATTGLFGWASGLTPAATSFYAGELVYTLPAAGAKVYLSLVSGNTTNPTTDTSGSWLTFTTAPTLALFNFIYPIGSGPSSETTSRNVFRLPLGFLREAPQEPKAGTNAFLGGPAGLRADDWNFEDRSLTTFDPGPLLFRFAADVSDPAQFDPLFVEGFSARLAFELCEPLTQSMEKIKTIGAEYKKFMGEARTVNGIETGYTEPPIDEYIAVRS